MVVLKYIWEYRYWIIIGALIAQVYIVGNQLKLEKEQHSGTIKQYQLEISNMEYNYLLEVAKIQQASIIAQQNALESYSVVSDKLDDIQKGMKDEKQSIAKLSSNINGRVDGLSNTIKNTVESIASNSSSGTEAIDPSITNSVRNLGEVSRECIAEYSKMGEKAREEQLAKEVLKSSWNAVRDEYNKDVSGDSKLEGGIDD